MEFIVDTDSVFLDCNPCIRFKDVIFQNSAFSLLNKAWNISDCIKTFFFFLDFNTQII